MALTKISNDGVKKPIDLADNEKVRLGTGNDLQIYHDGSHNYLDVISGGNGNLYMSANGSKSIYIRSGNGSSGVNQAVTCLNSGAVELYYDDSKKLETISTGVQINGNCNVPTGDLQLNDSRYAKLGDGGDFQLYFNGTDSYISHTPTSGKLAIRTDEIRISSYDGDEAMIKSFKDGATYLYYDGSNKIQTTAAGVTVTGTVSDSLGDVRSIPQNSQSSAYTLVASDAGKHVITDSAVTIPNSVFAAGDAVTIVNNSGSDIALTKSINNLYLSTDGSNASRTLAARGTATILFVSGTAGYISGAGLS